MAKPEISMEALMQARERQLEMKEAMTARLGPRKAGIVIEAAQSMILHKALHDVACDRLEPPYGTVFHAIQHQMEASLVAMVLRALIDPALLDGEEGSEKDKEFDRQSDILAQELKGAIESLMKLAKI